MLDARCLTQELEVDLSDASPIGNLHVSYRYRPCLVVAIIIVSILLVFPLCS